MATLIPSGDRETRQARAALALQEHDLPPASRFFFEEMIDGYIDLIVGGAQEVDRLWLAAHPEAPARFSPNDV